jgi:hypothetical protein
VNGPEILHLIRRDLQRAIACRGGPPTPQPMDVSPWLAMSTLQKAISRGHGDLALSAAATLLRDTPDKLWRRIGCIAYEDIGVASLEAVGLATAALGESKFTRHWGRMGGRQLHRLRNCAEHPSAGRPTIFSWPVSFTKPMPRRAPSCQT